MVDEEVLMDGVEEGVDCHWRLRKHLVDIKPEYLLTVAVADCLANKSLENGVDADIELESSTWSVSYQCLLPTLGQKSWGAIRRLWRKFDEAQASLKKMPEDPHRLSALQLIEAQLKAGPAVQVTRPGKVDIFVKLDAKGHYVVELKGFDPSDVQIRLDVERLRDFHLLNDKKNVLAAGFLVYPLLSTSHARLELAAKNILEPAGLNSNLITRSVSADAADGIEGYTLVCLNVFK